MRPGSVYGSVIFHVALIIIAIFGLPWIKRDFEVPQPISVEMVDIAAITQTTRIAPQPIPEPKEEPKEAEAPQPPPQPAQNTAADPTPPEPPKPEEKKPEEKKPEKEKEKPEIDPNALPDKKKPKEEDKKKEEKKPEPKKETKKDPSKDFASVLKNLAPPKEPAKQPDKAPDMKVAENAPAPAASNATLGPKMTMSEEDALRRQLEGCWSVPIGAKDAENLNIEIRLVINPDRTLREAKVVDTGRYGSDTFFRAAADSAMRAVRNPLCSPFQLPPDKYETWKTVVVNFNPRQMF